MTFFPCPKPISPPKAPNGVRKRNPERSGSEFKRCYHSRARQKFVNLQECLACGAWGYSQNAHVLGVDGASLKGPYTSIASLCGVRPDAGGVYQGCHNLFDTDPEAFRRDYPNFNPKRAARENAKALAGVRRRLAGHAHPKDHGAVR